MSHTVTLHPGGKSFSAPLGRSLLDAALDSGISLAYGCRNGACRSCRARLRTGDVHAPHGISTALSDYEREQGYLLLCQNEARSDLELDVEELDPSGRIQVRTVPVRLIAKQLLSHDVMALTLAMQADETFHFLAGQYVDILLRDGRRRAFSIANPPNQGQGQGQNLELHVRKVPGGSFSNHVFDALRERALMRITGPLGDFYLRDDDRDIIFVAGGTGFAPIKSMLEDALARDVTRPIHLYWGARERRDLYLDALATQWAQRYAHISYTPVLSDPQPGDEWDGRTGFVHQALLDDYPDLSQASVYLSGPPPMVDAARESAPAHGADAAHLFSDAFDYAHETGHDL